MYMFRENTEIDDFKKNLENVHMLFVTLNKENKT